MTLNSTVRENGDILITGGNRLTIESAGEFARIVKEALDASATVIVDFEPGAEIDITGMQVLCSACKSAAQSGKVFVFQGERPAALDGLIAASGAERHAECKHNNDAACIWFGGTR